MLQNEHSVAIFRFDAAEKELSEVLKIFAGFDELVMNKFSANIGFHGAS